LLLPHDDDAADDLSLAVQLRDPAARLGPEVDLAELGHGHGHAPLAGLHHDPAKIVERVNVAAPADEVLVLPHLEDAAADVLVRGLDRHRDLADRDSVGLEPPGIEIDLVLTDESADRRHLGHAVDALEPVAEVPVLEGSKLAQVVPTGGIDERVFEHPPDR